MAKPGLTIEKLTTDDTDRHGRSKARRQDGFADDAEGRREQTTIGAKMMGGEIDSGAKKNLRAMPKLGGEER